MRGSDSGLDGKWSRGWQRLYRFMSLSVGVGGYGQCELSVVLQVDTRCLSAHLGAVVRPWYHPSIVIITGLEGEKGDDRVQIIKSGKRLLKCDQTPT